MMNRVIYAFGLVLLLATAGAKAQVETAPPVVKSGNETAVKSARVKESAKESVETVEPWVEMEHSVWRDLDLRRGANAVLSVPENPEDGDNLLRLVMREIAAGHLEAFEFRSGRHDFKESTRLTPGAVRERFGIEEPADADASRWYLAEKWSYDNRTHAMKRRVEALCPVMEVSDELGDATRYPLFWVRYADVKSLLRKATVPSGGLDSRATHTLDEWFALGLYEGDIYMTSNPGNRTLAELHPGEENLKAARDSIENRLASYGKGLWMPTREEYLKTKNRDAEGNSEAQEPVETKGKKQAKSSKVKPSGGAKGGNENAARSVRRRRR